MTYNTYDPESYDHLQALYYSTIEQKDGIDLLMEQKPDTYEAIFNGTDQEEETILIDIFHRKMTDD